MPWQNICCERGLLPQNTHIEDEGNVTQALFVRTCKLPVCPIRQAQWKQVCVCVCVDCGYDWALVLQKTVYSNFAMLLPLFQDSVSPVLAL